MMSELYAIQETVYHAAANYHRAVVEYAVALHEESQSPRLKDAAGKCVSAGKEYRSRLLALLDYALTDGASEVDYQEIQRIRRLIELVDAEVEILS